MTFGWYSTLSAYPGAPSLRSPKIVPIRRQPFARSFCPGSSSIGGIMRPRLTHFRSILAALTFALLQAGCTKANLPVAGKRVAIPTVTSIQRSAFRIPLSLSIAARGLGEEKIVIKNISGHFSCGENTEKTAFADSVIESNCEPSQTRWMVDSFNLEQGGTTYSVKLITPNPSLDVPLEYTGGISLTLGKIGAQTATPSEMVAPATLTLPTAPVSDSVTTEAAPLPAETPAAAFMKVTAVQFGAYDACTKRLSLTFTGPKAEGPEPGSPFFGAVEIVPSESKAAQLPKLEEKLENALPQLGRFEAVEDSLTLRLSLDLSSLAGTGPFSVGLAGQSSLGESTLFLAFPKPSQLLHCDSQGVCSNQCAATAPVATPNPTPSSDTTDGLSDQPAPAVKTCDPNPKTISHNGHNYTLHCRKENWWSARMACEMNGEYLVTIKSQDENEAVWKLAEGEAALPIWLGATNESGGDWTWVNREGTTADFRFWANGQGMNLGTNCIAMRPEGAGWFDDTCSNGYAYVCESGNDCRNIDADQDGVRKCDDPNDQDPCAPRACIPMGCGDQNCDALDDCNGLPAMLGFHCNQSAPPSDVDYDGIPDNSDNCPYLANGDQNDADGDGMGNVCDYAFDPGPAPIADRDTDGIPDTADNCPGDPNPAQTDQNGNGIGDVCDPFYRLASVSLSLSSAGTDSVEIGQYVCHNSQPISPTGAPCARTYSIRLGWGDSHASELTLQEIVAGAGDFLFSVQDSPSFYFDRSSGSLLAQRITGAAWSQYNAVYNFPLGYWMTYGGVYIAASFGGQSSTDLVSLRVVPPPEIPTVVQCDPAIDSDNDGVNRCSDPDDQNACDPNPCSVIVPLPPTLPDGDGDGISDGVDNCSGMANADQLDRDGNGVGDACEPELPMQQPEADKFAVEMMGLHGLDYDTALLAFDRAAGNLTLARAYAAVFGGGAVVHETACLPADGCYGTDWNNYSISGDSLEAKIKDPVTGKVRNAGEDYFPWYGLYHAATSDELVGGDEIQVKCAPEAGTKCSVKVTITDVETKEESHPCGRETSCNFTIPHNGDFALIEKGTYCGDGQWQKDASEECDYGSSNDGDCQDCKCVNETRPNESGVCQAQPKCGDAVVNYELGEECDGGENCNNCHCASGTYNNGWGACVPPSPYCGDGQIDWGNGEECEASYAGSECSSCRCAAGWGPDYSNYGHCLAPVGESCGNGNCEPRELAERTCDLDCHYNE